MKKTDTVYIVNKQTKEIESMTFEELVERHDSEKEYKLVEVTSYEVHYRRGPQSSFGRVDFFSSEEEAEDCIFQHKVDDFAGDFRAAPYFDSAEDAEDYMKEDLSDEV
jgi:hypothetical protein